MLVILCMKDIFHTRNNCGNLMSIYQYTTPVSKPVYKSLLKLLQKVPFVTISSIYLERSNSIQATQ